MDDAQLIHAVKEGSGEAFQELLTRYEQRLFCAISRIIGDRVEAEDILQDVYLKAYRALDSFQFESGFYTWIYRIAINAAMDARKKRRRRAALSLEGEDGILLHGLAASEPGPGEAPAQRELLAALHRAVDELPEKFRTILVLREFEGLSYEELAAVLGLSKGTVESRLFRARMKLRQKMERFL
ncbi:MAG: sigma-70 family RNA polymerase sigma factor [Planctomycetota bacterium]